MLIREYSWQNVNPFHDILNVFHVLVTKFYNRKWLWIVKSWDTFWSLESTKENLFKIAFSDIDYANVASFVDMAESHQRDFSGLYLWVIFL